MNREERPGRTTSKTETEIRGSPKTEDAAECREHVRNKEFARVTYFFVVLFHCPDGIHCLFHCGAGADMS